MSRRILGGLRAKLAIPVLGVLVVLIGTFLLFVQPTIHGELLNSAERQIGIYASAISARMDGTAREALTELESVARLEGVRALEKAALDRVLAEHESSSPFFRHFTVLDAAGVIVSRPTIPEHVGESRANRPYFQKVIANGRSVVGEPRISSRNNLSLNMATPIFRESRVVGVLMGSLGLMDRNPAFYAAVLEPDLPAGWEAWLASRGGYLLAHSNRSISGSSLSAIDSSAHPFFDDAPPGYSGPRVIQVGDERWYAAAHTAETGWLTVVQAPEELVVAPVTSVTRRILAAVTVGMTALFVIAFLMSGRIVRPVEELALAMSHYGKGEPATLSPGKGNGEVEAAQRAFNSMVRERARAEQQLRTRDEQLQRAAKLEALGRLAGGVAHDFNNVLTVIAGYAELLQPNFTENDPKWRMLEEIRRSAARGADITSRLLAFSRKQLVGTAVVDVLGVTEGVIQLLRPLIGEHIELAFRVSERPLRVRANEGKLEDILLNLAMNARDAMPQGGRLVVETALVELPEGHDHDSLPPGSYAELTMTDSGEGMTESVRERVFEPFFTTKEPGKGTGLGLAMVYGLVKQWRGDISVASTPGKGTAVRILLPHTEEPSPIGEGGIVSAPPRQRSATVLVVEDDAAVLSLTSEVLERQGYRVLRAGGPALAIKIAGAFDGDIDLLLTDVVMPSMNGIELSQRVTSQRPETAVLFASGYAEEALKHAVHISPDRFIAKPYKAEELLAGVEEVMRAHRAAPAR